MAIRNLDKIFKPKRVAVIGASDNHESVGYTVLRNMFLAGFRGVVYPVNPKYEAVQGIQAYASLKDLPQPADLAIICTPAATVPDLVRECGEAGTRGAIIISAGFREIGEAGRLLEQQIADEARKFDGMRIIGPNCLGVIAPAWGLNASFAANMPAKGKVAFISQSGALCTSVLDWSLRQNIGFSHFVSVGNMLDVGMADLIDYFSVDSQTESIILYVESIKDARQFMSAARAFTRSKPIVAFKAGRFAESAQAAASHTGALAGVDAVYEAALARAGIVRVSQVDDMFDCAELLARPRHVRGNHLAIVTNAGGPGVMATDALLARGGALAALSPTTIEKLDPLLPEYWSHGNPVDVLGDAPPERFAKALETVLTDPQVDAALVILTPQAMTDPTGTARSIATIAGRSSKPVLAAWMGGASVAQGISILNQAAIPTYETPEQAVRAFTYLVAYARTRDTLYETPRDVPVSFALDRAKLRGRFRSMVTGDHDLLSEEQAKSLLETYGIPTTRPMEAKTADAAIVAARQIGYPVVAKILSPDITHKTDVGGVELSLGDDEQVRAAFARIVNSARTALPDAKIGGVTIQKMIVAPSAMEMIVGAKKDPVFGSVILIGAGGVMAELFQDTALELPPLSERLARRMLESLRSWPLLCGYRGRPPANVDKLIEILIRFSYLVADCPEIAELDINPLLVTKSQVIALDARVKLDREALGKPHRPFSHLAIRPYPEEYVRAAALKDGTPVLLRPIKPEDEPLWHRLLASCSRESIWFRFRYVFKETTHEMATRHCFTDYDRELNIVAECTVDGQRKFLGVGQLSADIDHVEAEYAVLVADAWQAKGLGGLLTDYCLEIARNWGVRKIVAETSPENHRMLRAFERRGFKLDYSLGADAVLVAKELSQEKAPGKNP